MEDVGCEPFDDSEELPREVLAKAGTHSYLSTACHHGLHARCRVSCKFCSTLCECRCHN